MRQDWVHLACCVPATAPAQFSVHSTGAHLQLGQTRTIFYTISVGELCHLHSRNEHVRYFFLTLLTFEGQISDPQNTRAGFKPDFWISRLFWEALEEPWECGCLCELFPPQLTKTALQTRHVALAGIPQVLLSLFSITLESVLF